MIVDAERIGAERAVAAMRALEVELFGRHAWSEAAIRQELTGPGRAYLFDIAATDHADGASTQLDGALFGPDGALTQLAAVAVGPDGVPVAADSESETVAGGVGDGADRAAAGAGGDGAMTVRGFAGYWYDGEDAQIMDIGVAKAFQRRGVACGLLRAIIDRARAQGAGRVLLEVSVENAPAISLYERFGFTRIGLRKRYYQPEGIDAHVMALDLAARVVGFQRATDADGRNQTRAGADTTAAQAAEHGERAS